MKKGSRHLRPSLLGIQNIYSGQINNYEEFFDLEKDSTEKNNLITDASRAPQIESLKERFKILKELAK
jgi:hypothetical protein